MRCTDHTMPLRTDIPTADARYIEENNILQLLYGNSSELL